MNDIVIFEKTKNQLASIKQEIIGRFSSQWSETREHITFGSFCFLVAGLQSPDIARRVIDRYCDYWIAYHPEADLDDVKISIQSGYSAARSSAFAQAKIEDMAFAQAKALVNVNGWGDNDKIIDTLRSQLIEYYTFLDEKTPRPDDKRIDEATLESTSTVEYSDEGNGKQEKHTNKLLVGILVVAGVLILAGIVILVSESHMNNPKDDIIGTWTATKYETLGVELTPEEADLSFTLCFRGDGTVEASTNGEEGGYANWSFDSTGLSIYDDSVSYECQYTGEYIIVEMDGVTFYLQKE